MVDQDIMLNIKLSHDDSINQIKTNKSSTIEDLKYNIQKKLNFKIENQILIFKGDILENKKEINYEEFLTIINQKDKDVDEEEEVLKAFKVFDKDGNGLININELKDIMLNFGNNWSEEELNEMFKEADIDMDGYLNYEEFVRTMLSK